MGRSPTRLLFVGGQALSNGWYHRIIEVIRDVDGPCAGGKSLLQLVEVLNLKANNLYASV